MRLRHMHVAALTWLICHLPSLPALTDLYFWMVILACISLSLCIMWVTGLLKFAGLDRMRLKLRLMFGTRKQSNKMRRRKQQRKQKKLF